MYWLRLLVFGLLCVLPQSDDTQISGKFVKYKGWEKLQSSEGTRYVLVTATWCAPCRVLKADIEERIFPYGINVILVDYDEHTDDALRMLEGGSATLPRLIRYRTGADGKVEGTYWNSANKTLVEFFELKTLQKQ